MSACAKTPNPPAARARLSACVMVKDGGELFRNMLWSIGDRVDEIVVVNTDDKPRNPDTEAAEFFGARVIHSTWRDDFSAHRNESIAAASGDWLLIIDADEELVCPEGLRQWLAAVPEQYQAVQGELLDIRGGRAVMRFPTVRLFRAGRVKYRGRVHNQPELAGGRVLAHPGLAFRHFGYGLSPEDMAKKIARSQKLLLRQLAEGDQQAHFYLAQQKGMNDDPEGCARHCEEYLEAREALGEKFNPSVYYAAAASYLRLERRQDAARWIKAGLALMPDDPDLAAALSDLGQADRDWGLMVKGARLYLANREKYLADPATTGGRFVYTVNPANLSVCLYRLAMFNLWEGRRAWRALQQSLPQTQPELARLLAGEGKKRLAAMGMEELAREGRGQPGAEMTEAA